MAALRVGSQYTFSTVFEGSLFSNLRKIPIRHYRIWLQTHGLLGLRYSLFVLPEHGVNISQVAGSDRISGICPCPDIVNLSGLLQFSGDVLIVQRRDAIFLSFAYPVAQVIGLLDILGGQSSLAEI